MSTGNTTNGTKSYIRVEDVGRMGLTLLKLSATPPKRWMMPHDGMAELMSGWSKLEVFRLAGVILPPRAE